MLFVAHLFYVFILHTLKSSKPLKDVPSPLNRTHRDALITSFRCVAVNYIYSLRFAHFTQLD